VLNPFWNDRSGRTASAIGRHAQLLIPCRLTPVSLFGAGLATTWTRAGDATIHVKTPSRIATCRRMLTHAFRVGEFTCDDRWRPTFHFTDDTTTVRTLKFLFGYF
jgi:hypothetical protein